MIAPSDETLAAYLDESLPVERMSEIESALRSDALLRERLIVIIGRQDAGLHTIGAIWRRNRLSCPTREQLGQFLLGIVPESHAKWIQFHLTEVGCRYCTANWEDLQASLNSVDEHQDVNARRQRFFQTSAGHLRS